MEFYNMLDNLDKIWNNLGDQVYIIIQNANNHPNYTTK